MRIQSRLDALSLVLAAWLGTSCSDSDSDDDSLGESASKTTGSEVTGSTTSSESVTGEGTTTATTSSATAGDERGTSGDQASGSSSGGLVCAERNPDFECDPLDCADPIYDWECGGIELDEDGCMRAWCHAAEDCGADEICFKLVDCDPEAVDCGELGGCSMLDGECKCGVAPGCPDPPPAPEQQRGYCIPASLRPC